MGGAAGQFRRYASSDPPAEDEAPFTAEVLVHTGSPIIYEIDEQNCIAAVNPAWFDEAQTSHDRRLQEAGIVGQDLWSLIHEPTTRHLYETIIATARARGKSVGFGFRCDTPGERRLLHMEVVPQAGDHVAFEVSLVESQPRPSVDLLRVDRAQSDELIRMCSWCKRLPLDDESWVEVEEALETLRVFDVPGPLPAITHGICPECLAKVLEVADKEEPVVFGSLPPD
jgi:hypothetical protein